MLRTAQNYNKYIENKVSIFKETVISRSHHSYLFL